MQQEEQLDIDKLYYQIQTLNQSLKQGECIIFYGPTGVGKTTIFSYLNGYNMEIINTSQIDIVNKKQDDPKIGHSVKAETTHPNIKIKNQSLLVDLPGYDDNRSSSQRIANAIINHEIFKYYKKIRFILVLDYRAIQMRSALNIKDLINGIYMNLGQLGSKLVSNMGILINCCSDYDQETNIQQQLIDRYQTYFKDNIKFEELESVSNKVFNLVQIWKSLSNQQIQNTYVCQQSNLDDKQSHIIFLQILRKAKFFFIGQAQRKNNPFTDQIRDNLFDWIRQLQPIDSFSIRPNINTDDRIHFDSQLSIYSKTVEELIKSSVEQKICNWNQLLSIGVKSLEEDQKNIEILLGDIQQSQYDHILEWRILSDLSKKYSKIEIYMKEIQDNKIQWEQTLRNYLDKITLKRKVSLEKLQNYQKEQRELISLNLTCLQEINNFIFNQQLDIQKSISEILNSLENYEDLVKKHGEIDLKCAKALQDKQSKDFLTSKVLQLNNLLSSVLKYDHNIITQFKFEENFSNIEKAQQMYMKITKIFASKLIVQNQFNEFNTFKEQFNINTQQIHSLSKTITPYLNLLEKILTNTYISSVRNQPQLEISLLSRDYINIIFIKEKLESNLKLLYLE